MKEHGPPCCHFPLEPPSPLVNWSPYGPSHGALGSRSQGTFTPRGGGRNWGPNLSPAPSHWCLPLGMASHMPHGSTRSKWLPGASRTPQCRTVTPVMASPSPPPSPLTEAQLLAQVVGAAVLRQHGPDIARAALISDMVGVSTWETMLEKPHFPVQSQPELPRTLQRPCGCDQGLGSPQASRGVGRAWPGQNLQQPSTCVKSAG